MLGRAASTLGVAAVPLVRVASWVREGALVTTWYQGAVLVGHAGAIVAVGVDLGADSCFEKRD